LLKARRESNPFTNYQVIPYLPSWDAGIEPGAVRRSVLSQLQERTVLRCCSTTVVSVSKWRARVNDKERHAISQTILTYFCWIRVRAERQMVIISQRRMSLREITNSRFIVDDCLLSASHFRIGLPKSLVYERERVIPKNVRLLLRQFLYP
jgi:hypothetical protein